MKVELGSGEFVEVVQHDGKILLAIASRHPNNQKTVMVTTVELSLSQFNQLISDTLIGERQ
jgi:hypothetical protein